MTPNPGRNPILVGLSRAAGRDTDPAAIPTAEAHPTGAARHAHIHRHHVELKWPIKTERLGAVGCLTDHFDVVFGAEQGPETSPAKRLIVGRQHPDH